MEDLHRAGLRQDRPSVRPPPSPSGAPVASSSPRHHAARPGEHPIRQGQPGQRAESVDVWSTRKSSSPIFAPPGPAGSLTTRTTAPRVSHSSPSAKTGLEEIRPGPGVGIGSDDGSDRSQKSMTSRSAIGQPAISPASHSPPRPIGRGPRLGRPSRAFFSPSVEDRARRSDQGSGFRVAGGMWSRGTVPGLLVVRGP